MKCLLLLLTFRLVSSDKLDRTYLPPPGANYAGGNPEELKTPLEYLKPGITQNGQAETNINKENALGAAPANLDLDITKSNDVDYSSPQYPNELNQKNPLTSSGYGFDKTILKLGDLNGNIPSNQPNLEYLPSKQSTSNRQQFPITSNFLFNANANNKFAGNEKGSDNYYYVPAVPFNKNIENQARGNFELNNNINFGQYPNEINNDITRNKQFTPKTTTSNDIVQNYEPNAFGYYGGNPMIMITNSLPQEFGNVVLTSKFGEYEKMPSKPPIQDKLTNARTTPKPFQTPLVRSNIQKGYSKKPQTTTISPRRNNSPIEVNQRSDFPSRKSRPERLLADLDRKAVIINYENGLNPEGFSYSFDTSNGIHADESGTAINGVRVKGSYSYTGDDGKIYTVSYTADENGFQPKGDHLPTPPPVPEVIKKVIEQAGRNRAAGIIDDGSYDEKKYGHLNYLGAMDRYRPFKYNEIPGINRRIGNNKSKSYNTLRNLTQNIGILPIAKPDNNRELFNGGSTSSENSKNSFVTEENKNNDQEIHNQSQLNFVNRPQAADNENNQKVNTKSGTNRMSSELTPKESNQNAQQNLDQNYIPTTPINGYNQVRKGNRPNPNIFFETRKPVNQIYTSNAGKSNDDGYFYVPPFIKFNPVSKEIVNKKGNVLPQQIVNTTITKRIDIDNDQNNQILNQRVIPTEIPNKNTIAITNTKRKFYNHDTANEKPLYNDDSNRRRPIDGFDNPENQHDSITSYITSTTPMASQATQNENQQNNGYYYPNPYYETTNNQAAVFEPLPNVADNRISPTRTPGITVSQDFVTTTFKPSLLNDGVLEVNQNVKIYGLGSTEPTITYGNFLEKDNYNNEIIYTTAIPNNEELEFGTYPEEILQSPDQDTIQGNINQVNNNEFNNDNPLFDSVIPINELTDLYDQNFDTRLDGVSEFPKNPYFTVNDFKNTELEGAIPTVTPRIQNPTIAEIGEDFSGPKQSQKFNPITGYYYK